MDNYTLSTCPFCGELPRMDTEGFTRIVCRCGITMSDGNRSQIKLADKWNNNQITALEKKLLKLTKDAKDCCHEEMQTELHDRMQTISRN